MDEATHREVTSALDNAIAQSADARLGVLSKQHGPQQTAKRIVDALRSLKRLRSGGKPEYDEWAAIFYALWYQPGQVNLAYTLARALLEEIRGGESYLRLDDGWHLHVDDLGCGTWAMQFGLTLAMVSLKHPSQALPVVTMNHEDESPSMKAMGGMIWREYLANSQGDVAQACRAVKKQPPDGMRFHQESWLTALHTFYEEDDEFRKVGFPREVERTCPDNILVTTQGKSADYLPPIPDGYRDHGTQNDLEISGNGGFVAIDEFRSRIFTDHVQDAGISDENSSFAQNYLTSRRVSWTSDAVIDCARRCYRRSDK